MPLTSLRSPNRGRRVACGSLAALLALSMCGSGLAIQADASFVEDRVVDDRVVEGRVAEGGAEVDGIHITADEGWEDVAPDVVHFRGHFRMLTADWRVSADSATVRGRMDAPDEVTVQGSPAQVQFFHPPGDQAEPVVGQAAQLVYSRERNAVVLSGGASLSQGANTIHSEFLEYDIDQNRFHSRGPGGVQLSIPVDD